MRKNTRRCLAAGALGAAVAVGVAAHAAVIDLNRVFGVVRDTGTAVTGIAEKDEIAIGRELAGRTLGAAPLVDDKALQAYVNNVGRWVASKSERAELPWRFGVIETPGVNAFAAPGGVVLITRGLYEMLDNEAQLAAVLGHEIAHIVKRHHITVMQQTAGVAAISGAAQTAATARGGAGGAVFNSVIGTGAEVFARGLDKSAEYEADLQGALLAARAGYSPAGMIDVLHKLHARSGDPSTNLLFATHPHPGERLTALGDSLAPHMAKLAAGREPALQVVAVAAPRGATGAAKPVAPAGMRALSDEAKQPESATPSLPSGLTGGAARQRGGTGAVEGVLRGILGR